MKRPVKLYMRVQNQKEICIGSARSMADVPRLLESVATMFRAELEPDEPQDEFACGTSEIGARCRW